MVTIDMEDTIKKVRTNPDGYYYEVECLVAKIEELENELAELVGDIAALKSKVKQLEDEKENE